MLENDYFNAVFHMLRNQSIGEAIRALRELMEKNRAIVADDTFHTIAADHDRMLDYMEQGYDDPQREEIYQRLVRRLWFFTRSALMTWLCTSKSMFREARQKSGQQQFTPDDIERTLHNFVSDVAMLSLETDEAKLLKEAAPLLAEAGFDIEIVEKHHNLKKDAPSGTAILLADSINEALTERYEYAFDRSTRNEKRPKKEIGISAVRAGTIPGDHDVIFGGEDEVITFSHKAYSKAVFAKGAIRAAGFLKGKKSGLYSMSDVV